MSKLTVKKLVAMQPREIFASGTTRIEHHWWGEDGSDAVCDENGMTDVKWVAVRGSSFHDWTIYHSLNMSLTPPSNNYFNNGHLKATDKAIADLGTKLTDMSKVKELVECDEESLELYRR